MSWTRRSVKNAPQAALRMTKVAWRPAALYCLRLEPRGIYRERNGWGKQRSAHVKYDEHHELDLSEDRYRARAYLPPFDQLPWKDAAGDLEAKSPSG